MGLEKTRWFPMKTPPSRKGWYECDSCYYFHKWNGKFWIFNRQKISPDSWFFGQTKWRGIVRPNAK